jgi:hypothetical protein
MLEQIKRGDIGFFFILSEIPCGKTTKMCAKFGKKCLKNSAKCSRKSAKMLAKKNCQKVFAKNQHKVRKIGENVRENL